MKSRGRLKTKDISRFVEKALDMGADRVKVVRAASVRCEPWVRLKCQYGCGGYGKRLTCPPFTPTPEETARAVACYLRAILLHSNDEKIVNEIVPRLERDIFLSGFHMALGLGSGPCRICERCDTGALCKYPELARPSMEACGINVFSTVRANGFSIEVVRTTRQIGDYFGLILVD
jgi:predicted metal-binding protein